MTTLTARCACGRVVHRLCVISRASSELDHWSDGSLGSDARAALRAFVEGRTDTQRF
jgi:hypothetical protein